MSKHYSKKALALGVTTAVVAVSAVTLAKHAKGISKKASRFVETKRDTKVAQKAKALKQLLKSKMPGVNTGLKNSDLSDADAAPKASVLGTPINVLDAAKRYSDEQEFTRSIFASLFEDDLDEPYTGRHDAAPDDDDDDLEDFDLEDAETVGVGFKNTMDDINAAIKQVRELACVSNPACALDLASEKAALRSEIGRIPVCLEATHAELCADSFATLLVVLEVYREDYLAALATTY